VFAERGEHLQTLRGPLLHYMALHERTIYGCDFKSSIVNVFSA
jgi:hypothetical protein